MRIFNQAMLSDAQTYYRAELPHRHCSTELRRDNIVLETTDRLAHTDYDVFIFHNLINPTFFEVFMKLPNKKVWSLDDNFWHLDETNPVNSQVTQEVVDSCTTLAQTVDEVVVSTEPLKEQILSLAPNQKVTVLPNLIDLEDFKDFKKQEHTTITILWAGSIHHEKDLRLLIPCVEELCPRHDNIQFQFWCDIPLEICEWVKLHYTNLAVKMPARRFGEKVGYIDGVAFPSYYEHLMALSPDIMVAPLINSEFNACKSNLKVLDAAAVSCPIVASNVYPYINSPAFTGADFTSILDKLITDKKLREISGVSNRKWLEKNYSWQTAHQKQKWLDFYRGL